LGEVREVREREGEEERKDWCPYVRQAWCQ